MVTVGVRTSTVIRSGPSTSTSDPASRVFMAGVTERGPVGAAGIVRSLNQFVATYGARQSYSGYLYDAVRTAFEEGATEIAVARVVGTTPVLASYTFNDRAGTPLPTLKVSAINPGAWAAEISVAVIAGTTSGVNIVVSRTVNSVSSVVETWANLADVPSIVNALLSSLWVRGTNLGSVTVGAQALPALHTAVALAGGDDNRSTVTASGVVAAANALFTSGLGTGAICAPGYPADVVGAGLIAHAKANGRVALLAGAIDADVTALAGLAAGLSADGAFAGVFGPWCVIPDGALTQNVDPTGFIAGVRARAINAVGFWQRPPGVQSAARFVKGTVWVADEAANNTAAAAAVSLIVTYPTSIELQGWWSLAIDGGSYGLLSNQDALNVIEAKIRSILRQYVWANVDSTGGVFGLIQSDLEAYLQPVSDAGGLFKGVDTADGSIIDQGYRVEVDSTLNPVSQIGNNVVAAAVGVRLSPAIAELDVSIYRAGLTESV